VIPQCVLTLNPLPLNYTLFIFFLITSNTKPKHCNSQSHRNTRINKTHNKKKKLVFSVPFKISLSAFLFYLLFSIFFISKNKGKFFLLNFTGEKWRAQWRRRVVRARKLSLWSFLLHLVGRRRFGTVLLSLLFCIFFFALCLTISFC